MDEPRVEDQLRSAGRQELPADLADRHLSAISGVTTSMAQHRRRRTAAKVTGAFVAGLVLGSSGLAAAGSLPGPAQNAAASAFAVVGVEVPRSTEDCPDGRQYASHGEYVSEVAEAGGDVRAAAQSRCGMPVTSARGTGGPPAHAGAPDGVGRPEGAGPPDGVGRPHAEDPCRGRPPWAGRTDLSEDERAAMQAERGAQCPESDEPDAGRPEGAGPPEGQGPPEGVGPPEGQGPPENAGPPEDAAEE